jgi:hypothetical protein
MAQVSRQLQEQTQGETLTSARCLNDQPVQLESIPLAPEHQWQCPGERGIAVGDNEPIGQGRLQVRRGRVPARGADGRADRRQGEPNPLMSALLALDGGV